jgi:surface protein
MSYFNFGLVTSLSESTYAFHYNGSLETLNLSHANMSNVTNMKGAFSYDSNLKILDLSYADMSSVTDMYDFCYNNQKLESFDMSYAKTDSVQDFRYVFKYCYVLSDLNLTGISFESLQKIGYTFYFCHALTSLDLSMFTTPNLLEIDNVIRECNNLEEVNLSNWGSDVLTRIDSVFAYNPVLKKITMDNFNFGVANIGNATFSSPKIEEISVKYGNALNTESNRLFGTFNYYLSKVKTIDLTGFVFGSSMNSFFYSAPETLTTLILDDIDTSHVVDMRYMFSYCSFTTLDLSGWDVSNVTNFDDMFYHSSNLTTVDLTGWTLSIPSNMSTISMGNIFRDASVTDVILDDMVFTCLISGLLSNNSSIKKISAKNWVIPSSFNNVFFRFFGGGTTVEEIDVTGWDLSNASDINGLFGTNGSYGTNLNRIVGLDTWDTSNITNMSYMFQGCVGLTELDLSSFDTSNVTTMQAMFQGCIGLTSVDVNSFDTSNVTNMSTMFLNCSSLSTLDLSSFDMSNVSDMGGMFAESSSLTTVYAKTQADADILSAAGGNPTGLSVVVKT